MCYQAAVEYRLTEAAEPTEAFLPLDFLSACEGRSAEPVNLDTSAPGKVTASWADKRVPMVVEPPRERARARRPAKKSGSSSLEQLIALRDALRAAVNQVNELIRVQKRANRESRLVQSTLASLRQLQKAAC